MKKENQMYRQKMLSLLNKWQKSGCSQKSFCRSEGISYYSFKYWKNKFHQEQKYLSRHEKNSLPAFIPVATNQDTQSVGERHNIFPGNNCQGVQVAYPNGVHIVFPSELSFEQLKKLIKVF